MSTSKDTSWIDVSMPIVSGMVHWPGDPEVVVDRVQELSLGHDANLSRLSLGAHAGTHVDAPAHFLVDGTGVEAVPPEQLLGPVRVVAIDDPIAVTPAELERHDLAGVERVLFRTKNSTRPRTSQKFLADYVYVSLEAAHWLVDHGIRTVGIDYLSIGGGEHIVEIHRVLLAARVCIIEGLDLAAAGPGDYELICLPLRITGADGAPARVLLRLP